MSSQSINNYYNKLSQYKRFGGTRNESSTRRAFANLLEDYCLPKNLVLVDELKLKNSPKRPDGTVKDALQLDWGYWESKDTRDDLNVEIDNKIKIGYPTFNLIFENSETIVLIQEGTEILRGDMKDADFLHRTLTAFVEYERKEIKEFHDAVDKFKQDIPDIVEALRAMIADQEQNPNFRLQRDFFWNVCRESINLTISAFDIREMLIQHILTAEIFDSVFGDSHFHRENNIARELETVVNTFFTGSVRRNTLATIDNYYKTIKREAAGIQSNYEKQKFLKVIYENFYKAYNPKGADKLGVVYTPNEIVKFMVEAADYLLHKHFGKSLSDRNVQILDPATGTGTFITEIIEYIPEQYLAHKFKHELHCNELAILPYYIANLNIEYTYFQKMGDYQTFENIVFVDTLDNLGFSFAGKQQKLFAMSTENMERIRKQNSNKISVIIGNPPYNANQMNENDNNKNRDYPEIDKRIKDTYIKQSTAQKTKLYDMYSRFYRWAMDRIDKNGIIAFITNRSFIDSRTFDGFRKITSSEFNRIYIIDLGGDVRKNPKLSGSKHNVFGIQTGVAIVFLVRADNILDVETEEDFEKTIDENFLREPMVRYGEKVHYSNRGCRIHYYRRPEFETAREKLDFLQTAKLINLPFEIIHPDKENNWIQLTDNDFDTLLPLANKQTKLSKNSNDENSVFKLFSLGVVSNRDEWVYDFNEQYLREKTNFFCQFYLSEKKRWYESPKADKINDFVDRTIKWTSELENNLIRNKSLTFNENKIRTAQYRPFGKHYLYFDKIIIHRPYQNDSIWGIDKTYENKVICLTIHPQTKNLFFCSKYIVDQGFGSRASSILPLFRYDTDGNRIENITDWGLEQFVNHYQNDKITKEDIFHYTYAVLHNPAYRTKYEQNLKREFPRLPFYLDFDKWVVWGKELMELHLNYEAVAPFDLKRHESEKPKIEPKAKLKATPEDGEIELDESTSLSGIPSLAWEYRLGNRSALHWILDQYKEKKPSDPTIAEKFNTYKFADYKETVIDLIKRVTAVSVRTMEIVALMAVVGSSTDFQTVGEIQG